MLYPQTNPYRQQLDLSGFWEFRFDPQGNGEQSGWTAGFSDGQPIAVPASWNDQFAERRDNLGNVNYPMSEVPCEKQRLILKLNNLERLSLGLEPEMTNICGDTQDED